MVFFKAQQMQRLAELLQRIQKTIEGEGGDLLKAEDDLRGVAREAGLDLEIARMADGPTLEAVLTGGGEDTESRRWLAAEVLFVDGLLALERAAREAEAEEAETEAAAPWAKARHLYRTLPEALDLPAGAVEPEERLRRIEEMEPEDSP
ncbi:MAG: hypothetical protein ACOC8K_05560 [Gemmatimonadota bacterium]